MFPRPLQAISLLSSCVTKRLYGDSEGMIKKKAMEMMISNKKKVTGSNEKNRIKLNTMGNSLNYRDLAYQKMQGISYDELLELQSETGISIQQLEFMYYNL